MLIKLNKIKFLLANHLFLVFQKYLNLILAQKIRYSTEAFESTYTHRQHIHLILDFIYANHKEISSKLV